MSTNCMKCVVNKRTGPDLLCDDCRVNALRERVIKITKERDYLFEVTCSNLAVYIHEKLGGVKPYKECLSETEAAVRRDLEKIHELEPGETLDGS